jgi:quinol monooxygenase YgiN
VELKAKPGKDAAVASFLAGAQAPAVAEPLTTAWFAVRFDSQTFDVFDAFETDECREAHLKGPIAAALMQRGTELLARAPEIRFQGWRDSRFMKRGFRGEGSLGIATLPLWPPNRL